MPKFHDESAETAADERAEKPAMEQLERKAGKEPKPHFNRLFKAAGKMARRFGRR